MAHQITSPLDRYADGMTISPRRAQKAEILGEALSRLLAGRERLTLVDFGCADGAVPVLLLRSAFGTAVARMVGITLLNYNDLPEKPAHTHPRFTRVIGDLVSELSEPDLPWGGCDAVLATAFFHYLDQPEIAFRHAARLLKPGGYLLAGMPARWVLALRQRGWGGCCRPTIIFGSFVIWTLGRCWQWKPASPRSTGRRYNGWAWPGPPASSASCGTAACSVGWAATCW